MLARAGVLRAGAFRGPREGDRRRKATMVLPTIPVSDLDRAKRFHGETLGFELLWENPASARFRLGGGE